jgi:hypothetical protein
VPVACISLIKVNSPTTTRMKMLILKRVLHVLLFGSAVFLFVLHVREVFEIFSEGRTNFSTKKEHSKKLQLPAVTLCSSPMYDKNKLKSYNIIFLLNKINETNNMGNKTLYDIFDEVSMVLNKDFSLIIKTDFSLSGKDATLVEGTNIITDTMQGEYYIDVYKMYTMWDGICYTIASNKYQTSEAIARITLVLNESISESKIPTSINGVLSTRDERYGSLYGSWPGASPFRFKLPLGSESILRIHKHVTKRLSDSTSETCTNYKNMAYASCVVKSFITELIDLSQDCENPCKLATMQNWYELLPNHTIPECLTVKDHNCMIQHNYASSLVDHTCKPTCSLTKYKGEQKEWEDVHAKNKLSFSIVFMSTSVTINEEYLVYDIHTFVGTVGGYMGLFIGFSFFDFGVLTVNYLIGKCFNGVQANILN